MALNGVKAASGGGFKMKPGSKSVDSPTTFRGDSPLKQLGMQPAQAGGMAPSPMMKKETTKSKAAKAFGGGAKVGLADDREKSKSAHGRTYTKKYRKNKDGKYVPNTSAKSLSDSIKKAKDTKKVGKAINDRMKANKEKTRKAAKKNVRGGAAKLQRQDRANTYKAKGAKKGYY